MGRVQDALDANLRSFIERQHLFFVATAPDGPGGHVNVSPKGLDTFRVIDDSTVAYLDLTGSGVETIAHLRQNGRITVMFCSTDAQPLILRLYGRGVAVLPDDGDFDELVACFPPLPGIRSVIRVAVDRVSTSCGFAVPLMELVGERDTLEQWAARRDAASLDAYRTDRNATSIDGLPGLDPVAG